MELQGHGMELQGQGKQNKSKEKDIFLICSIEKTIYITEWTTENETKTWTFTTELRFSSGVRRVSRVNRENNINPTI